jgi:hypothetical protein
MARIYLAWLDATTKLIPKTLLPRLVASDVGAIASSARGVSNGVAPLDENGRIPTANLPTGGYVTTAAFNEQIAALQAQIAAGGGGTGGNTGGTVNRPSVVTSPYFLPNIGSSTAGQPMAYTLTWAAPSSNGGGAITGYTITLTVNGTATTYQYNNVGPFSFSTQTYSVGTTVSVSIVANNSAGSSPAMGSTVVSGTLPVPAMTLGGGGGNSSATPPLAVSNSLVAPITGATAGGSIAYRLTWAKPTGGTPSSYVTQLVVDGTVVETKSWSANDTLNNIFPVVAAGKVVRIAVQPYYTASGNTTSGPIMGVAFYSGTLTPPAMTLDGNLATPAGSATGNDQYGDTYGANF